MALYTVEVQQLVPEVWHVQVDAPSVDAAIMGAFAVETPSGHLSYNMARERTAAAVWRGDKAHVLANRQPIPDALDFCDYSLNRIERSVLVRLIEVEIDRYYFAASMEARASVGALMALKAKLMAF